MNELKRNKPASEQLSEAAVRLQNLRTDLQRLRKDNDEHVCDLTMIIEKLGEAENELDILSLKNEMLLFGYR